MPYILALLAIAVTGYFWMNRARNAAHIASDLAGMDGFSPLMAVVRQVAASGGTDTSLRQNEALDAIARAFRVA